MAHKNTQISDFSEQSTNVEVWVEIVRVQETTSQLNLKEKHLILGDPNVNSKLYLFIVLSYQKFV